MLSVADNELLTRTGPGTAMGDLFRRFWMPALLSQELPEPDAPPVRVKIMGEDLVAFRDSEGRVGLVDPRCPHRGANLFFGRNELCGLRCAYHGWKFDVAGRCMDMPTMPPDSTFRDRTRITSYPVRESGDFVWAYLGPAGPLPSCRASSSRSCRRRTASSPRSSSSVTGRRRPKGGSTPPTSRSSTCRSRRRPRRATRS